jgi:hypothetical protein
MVYYSPWGDRSLDNSEAIDIGNHMTHVIWEQAEYLSNYFPDLLGDSICGRHFFFIYNGEVLYVN